MSVKTMITSPSGGRIIFDAVFSLSHNSNVMVTEHPVQSGASIADHSFMEQDEVQIEIGMTDTAISVNGPSESRSVNAYAQLYSLMAAREPITLITRLKTYRNMLITSISAPDDYHTMNALKANIYFKQINIVSVSTVKVQQTVSSSVATAKSGVSSSGSTSSSNSTSSKSSSKTKKSSSSKTSTKKKSTLKQIADKVAKSSSKVTTTKVAVKPSAATIKKAALRASKSVKGALK